MRNSHFLSHLAFAFTCLFAFSAKAEAVKSLLPKALSFDEVIALTPQEIDSARFMARANSALDRGELDLAEKWLAQSQEAPILSDHLMFQQARLLAARGQHEAVNQKVLDALDRFPETSLQSRLAALRARSLVLLGEEAEAQVAWEWALQGSDDLTERREWLLALSQSLERTRRSGESSGEMSPSAESLNVVVLPTERPIEERSAAQELEVAEAWVAQGRSKEAIEAYTRALEGELSEDDQAEAQFELGRIFFRVREYDAARAIFRSLDPEPRATLYWARSLARMGEMDRSIEKFEALASGPHSESADHAAYLVATLHEDRGDYEAARAHYLRVTKKSESEDRKNASLWNLGWMEFKAGDNEAARSRFAEMIVAEPSQVAALRPRYWAARAALRSRSAPLRRTGQAEMLSLAMDWPLSYYGWRAQQRLSRSTPLARADREPAFLQSPKPITSEAHRRIALLTLSGFNKSARTELDSLSREAASLDERLLAGHLAIELGDYHTGYRLMAQVDGERLGGGFEPTHQALFWLAWPPAYREAVIKSLLSYGNVEPELVWAIMREESGFRPAVMSSAGAVGLLQLMPETAESTAERFDLKVAADVEALQVAEVNIELGVAYLSYLSERFPDRMSAVIASYNAGPTAVARWLEGEAATQEDDEWVEEISYSQTRHYVKRVLRSLNAYESLY